MNESLRMPNRCIAGSSSEVLVGVLRPIVDPVPRFPARNKRFHLALAGNRDRSVTRHGVGIVPALLGHRETATGRLRHRRLVTTDEDHWLHGTHFAARTMLSRGTYSRRGSRSWSMLVAVFWYCSCHWRCQFTSRKAKPN